ncbi:bifunctional endoribonuclease/protein kinase ire1 [Steccherinum ochraceum]|uniref:non-specific serine/threonine protein kinase n=1 Tax=Steccherinum ochraceum TaxID=92696 RepID=A0A4R0RCX9_9APHY|nr:bifunctional endoribonuclease/protein kinase ire1 [Steccherinum ochraceum]
MLSIHHLLAFLALVAGITLAEVVSVRSAKNNVASQITDLSTRVQGRPHRVDFNLAGFGTIGDEESELLDVVLAASVDGKLHALNRTTGVTLWSLSSNTPSGEKIPNSLAPLVRTKHPEYDPDLTDEGAPGRETYVIEPQTGDIYVLSSPDSPLQRLPFTMPQLLDMVPFKFGSGEGEKMFLGRKETSLVLVELETGRVKSIECPWDPFEDFAAEAAAQEDDLDLDELDGSKPPTKSTEVYIGRTDYHVTIHTIPPKGSNIRIPPQNLSYSTYGPNNQDHLLQSIYRRTADDRYIESLPNGRIMSFRADLSNEKEGLTSQFLWARSFSNPVVAVFDVLHAPGRREPYVLLQPRPRLQDIFPHVDITNALKENQFPNFKSAYVGIVEETGSLFAMSPDRYPLVVFSDADSVDDYGVGRSIDPPPGSRWDFDSEFDLPLDIDSVAKRAKLRQLCRSGSWDMQCFVGVKELESSQLSRLLDGAPSVPLPPYYNNHNSGATVPPDGNASITPPVVTGSPHGNSTPPSGYFGLQNVLTAVVTLVALTVATLWAYRQRSSSSPLPQITITQNGHAADVQSDPPILEAPVTSPLLEGTSSTPEISPKEEAPATPGLSTPRPSTPRPRTISSNGEADLRSPSRTGQIVDDAGLDGEGEDSDGEGDAPATPGRKKGPRRKRGKKKKGAPTPLNGLEDLAAEDNKAGEIEGATPGHRENDGFVHVVSPSAIVVPPPATPTPTVPSLIVSETILGFGSHGTVVFKGSLQGRAVAVKRLLQDFVTLALREVNILQESDDHPNVIRYYYQESQSNFLYIALELCPASLADVIERPDHFRDISIAFDPKRALRQITSGLRHLHALKIVHRDIKPQNILISHAKKGAGESAGHRMLISDFGLCKKLEVDQTSFLPTAHGAMAAGTVGWRAPEILRGEVKLDDTGGEDSVSSRGSTGTAGPDTPTGTPTGKPTRLTRAVDIFALGCLFYYVLTNGSHPFGDRYEREANIFKDTKNLDGLQRFGEEGSEAVDIITKMLSPVASERPDTSTCLIHPYFWDPGKRLNFLQDASDRFEIMCRDPRDLNLVELEKGAINVVGPDWNARLDKWFIENLGKFRKYDGKSVQDLLRALRNKKHHYQDLPDNVKRQVGPMPEGFLSYFTRRFPRLFLHVHGVIAASPLRQESMFRIYFELNEHS